MNSWILSETLRIRCRAKGYTTGCKQVHTEGLSINMTGFGMNLLKHPASPEIHTWQSLPQSRALTRLEQIYQPQDTTPQNTHLANRRMTIFVSILHWRNDGNPNITYLSLGPQTWTSAAPTIKFLHHLPVNFGGVRHHKCSEQTSKCKAKHCRLDRHRLCFLHL